MVDQAEDCVKSFQYFLRVIFGWHLPHSVPMTSGEEAGQRSCSIDSQVMVHSMVMRLEIFYWQRYGTETPTL
jgi:hypothetical protein